VDAIFFSANIAILMITLPYEKWNTAKNRISHFIVPQFQKLLAFVQSFPVTRVLALVGHGW